MHNLKKALAGPKRHECALVDHSLMCIEPSILLKIDEEIVFVHVCLIFDLESCLSWLIWHPVIESQRCLSSVFVCDREANPFSCLGRCDRFVVPLSSSPFLLDTSWRGRGGKGSSHSRKVLSSCTPGLSWPSSV